MILQFWRIPYEDIPKGDATEFLFSEWDKMQAVVNELKAELAFRSQPKTPLFVNPQRLVQPPYPFEPSLAVQEISDYAIELLLI